MNDDGSTSEPVGSAALPTPLEPPVDVPLTVLPQTPCPYLPGRQETIRAFRTNRLPGAMYQEFMDAGFRRSGTVVYQPVCEACRACVPIRVPVDRFVPGKTQRRTLRRNADLRVTVGLPTCTDEKFELYQRYQTHWHDKASADPVRARKAFESFLYESPVDSLEFCYRSREGKLLAVGLADVCAKSFSSVYFYFDPDPAQRSLGTFGALYEIAWARERHIPYYYLGFWVQGCAKMEYKSLFKPSEVLGADGDWSRKVSAVY